MAESVSTAVSSSSVTQRDGKFQNQHDTNSNTSPSYPKAETKKRPLLINWDDLPAWQRDNHYILTGYVPETSSIKKSLLSLTYLHNESVNIYSHLVPSATALIFCLLFLSIVLLSSSEKRINIAELIQKEQDLIKSSLLSSSKVLTQHNYEKSARYTLSDNAAFLVFISGAATCLGLSAIFHTLKSHSYRIATFGNQLDYLGIVILISTSMISLVNYMFVDLPAFRLTFWGITMVLGTICGVVSLKAKFRLPEWRTFRASMFVAFGLSGVLPVLAGVIVFGTDEVWSRSGLFYILSEAVLYISGAAIYAARIPERYSPGKYDIWGHSHQIFHFLVVLAAISHGVGLYKACLYAHDVTIPHIH